MLNTQLFYFCALAWTEEALYSSLQNPITVLLFFVSRVHVSDTSRTVLLPQVIEIMRHDRYKTCHFFLLSCFPIALLSASLLLRFLAVARPMRAYYRACTRTRTDAVDNSRAKTTMYAITATGLCSE